MASSKQQLLDAIAKYGQSVEHIAAQYTNPVTGQKLSGRALLAKLVQGESAALSDPDAAMGRVSSAGARGVGQFTAGSRKIAIDKYGIDPWRSIDEAVHATSLHLRGRINGSTALRGYNPGSPTYTDYILNQKVGHLAGSALKPSRASATGGSASLGGAGSPVASAATSSGGSFDGGSALSQAIELATKPIGVPSQPIAAPSFAAAPVMPQGYGQSVQSGAPAPAADLQLPEPTQTALPDVVAPVAADGAGITAAAPAPGQTAATTNAARGHVIVAPGAERDGHGLQKPILGFLRAVSAASGRDVTVTTGTSHSQYVAGTNRQSDHWDGNASDLGLGGDARQDREVGKRGDLIAAHALQVASQRSGDGITFAAALKLAKRGGIFNYETPGGRVQIIWRASGHYDHVHVGLNPGR